jgi:hypothetical protein
MHQEWTDQLSGYLDGELDPASRRRLEAHLAGCPACAAVRDDLARLIAAAPGYRGSPPASDLWPSIAAELERGRVTPISRARVPQRWRLAPYLIAAGLAAVMVGGGALWLRWQASPETVAGTAPGVEAGRAIPVVFEPVGYDAAVAELERTLASRRSELDTATVRVLEESLALIDRAIAEARAAIQRDSGNAYLNEQIAGNLRKKLNVLRLATRAIGSET